ncbi:MAG: hypothetical protein GY714_21555, partial [Desulfobacterales bacterium]|nr:hypothetical protein [Desulfobacterales bacterium]
ACINYLELSPDGEKLLFSESGQISVIDVDGTGLVEIYNEITYINAAHWTPDCKVIYTLEDNSSYHIVNNNGTGHTMTIVPGAYIIYEARQFSSDKKIILYGIINSAFNIGKCNADGSEYINLKNADSIYSAQYNYRADA